MYRFVIPAKAGIQSFQKILDAPVSSTGQAPQVRHDSERSLSTDTIDGLVKSRKILIIVIPRLDRAIQSFQVIISPLDTGSCRRTGETTFYEFIHFELTQMAEITILKEASEIGLAVMLSDLIRQNLDQDPGKIKLFNSLDAKALIEARDIQITVGLEFKQGELTVSEGFSVKPDLHIIADSSTILDLCLLKTKFGLPYFFDANGFKVFKKLLARKLIIKGLLRHFFTLVKLTRLFSVI